MKSLELILTGAILFVLIWAIGATIDPIPSILSEIVPLAGAVGPESIAFDPKGKGPYTGVADGRILKWQGRRKGWVDFAITTSQRKMCFQPNLEHICGRPLGLGFDKKNGDLYIADAYFGLLVVGPNGGLATPLVTQVEGSPLRFTNDLDIDEHHNVIYFTDTSTIFYRRDWLASMLSGDKTGRLMKYEKSRKQVTVLLQGLAFPNGVALSKDGSFVLVTETTNCRILRYWLQGPNAGNRDIFADLPGFPDNIRTNSKGEFWVALNSKFGFLPKSVSSLPLGKALLNRPRSIVGVPDEANAIKLSENGKVLQVLEDKERKLSFSQAEERNGKLWLASVVNPFLGIYNLF